jgi:hypothetical protein
MTLRKAALLYALGTVLVAGALSLAVACVIGVVCWTEREQVPVVWLAVLSVGSPGICAMYLIMLAKMPGELEHWFRRSIASENSA